MRTFAAFVLVSGAGFLIDLGLSLVLHARAGLQLWQAAAIGFCAVACLNYVVFEYWLLGTARASAARLAGVLAASGVALALRVGAVLALGALLAPLVPEGPARSALILTGAAAVSVGANFLLNRHLVFRSGESLMDALVGHTGFVGGNLARQHAFGALYHSRTVEEMAGRAFDRLVVAALPARMWQANARPEDDRANMERLIAALAGASAAQAVVISTIAVYRDPAGAPDEASTDYEAATPYGRHRREFEERVTALFPRCLILRLPALFGPGLSKNFLFDLMNPVPSFLSQEAHGALTRAAAGAEDRALVARAFRPDPATGRLALDRDVVAGADARPRLEALVREAGVSATGFTHADSTFQFYDLTRLWSDIGLAMDAGCTAVNLATEPLRAGDIHAAALGREMTERSAPLVRQDMRTRHASVWGRDDGRVAGADTILPAILRMVARGGT